MWTPTVIVTLALASGCAGKSTDLEVGSCTELAEKYIACIAPTGSPQNLRRHCKKYPNDFESLIPCGAEPDCDAFSRCLATYRQSADPERRRKRIEKYIEQRDLAEAEERFRDAQHICNELMADPDPEAEQLTICESLPTRALSALESKLQLLRDLPQAPFGHLSLCKKAIAWAKATSKDAEARVATLCAEAEASIATVALMKEVKRRMKESDLRLPPECLDVEKTLKQLGTDWSQRLRSVVLKECYVKLGGRILNDGGSRCSANRKRALAAAERYPELVTTTLSDAVNAARAQCD